jgi:hypothetical protein
MEKLIFSLIAALLRPASVTPGTSKKNSSAAALNCRKEFE